MELSTFLVDELCNYGFRITPKFTEDKELVKACMELPQPLTTLSVNNLLLRSDLRRHCDALLKYFPTDMPAYKNDYLPTPELCGIVLQIVVMVNINQPGKRRDEDIQPRFLAITLSDGHSKMCGIEYEPLRGISISSCPPGSKILFRGGRVRNGKLLLTSKNFVFLGGEVAHIGEAWQADKNAKRVRSLGFRGPISGDSDQPPKFDVQLRPGRAEKASAAATAATAKTFSSARHLSAAVSTLPVPISSQPAARQKAQPARGVRQPARAVHLQRQQQFHSQTGLGLTGGEADVSETAQLQDSPAACDHTADGGDAGNNLEFRRLGRQDRHRKDGLDCGRRTMTGKTSGGREGGTRDGCFDGREDHEIRCSSVNDVINDGTEAGLLLSVATVPSFTCSSVVPLAGDFPALPPSSRPNFQSAARREETAPCEKGGYVSRAVTSASISASANASASASRGGICGVGNRDHGKRDDSINEGVVAKPFPPHPPPHPAVLAAGDFPALLLSSLPKYQSAARREETAPYEKGGYVSRAVTSASISTRVNVGTAATRPPSSDVLPTVGLGDFHLKVKPSKKTNQWTCACCTFVNNPQMSYCEMCESKR